MVAGRFLNKCPHGAVVAGRATAIRYNIDMIEITLNGEMRRFDQPVTIAGLLERLDLHNESVAVELNEAIVPRSHHGEQQLDDGDRIEIVRAIGGG